MPSESKAALRRRMLLARAAISAHDRARADAAIEEHVLACPPYREASAIGAYAAIGSEVATAGILADACRRLGWVALPVTDADTQPGFARCEDVAHLVRGPHGALMPPEPWTLVEPEALDCALVPGVAFGTHGARLGRGAGFYDRLLPRVSGTIIGVAYALQVVDDTPLEPHDVLMDALVTEAGYRKCAPGV